MPLPSGAEFRRLNQLLFHRWNSKKNWQIEEMLIRETVQSFNRKNL